MISEKDIKEIDSSNMFNVLKIFYEQVRYVLNKANELPKLDNPNQKFLLFGIGGSAIAGDLLQSFFRNSELNSIEIFVNRNYFPLYRIEPSTNVIVSSYSGNTEETLEAFSIAKKYTKNIIGITSGGKLENILQDEGFPLIKLPEGYQPRAAIGYSFFSLLLFIGKSFAPPEKYSNLISELILLEKLLKEKSKIYSEISSKNIALEYAKKLFYKIPIIYACEETLFPVAMRFRAQIQENAKCLAFASPIPEMNHNEINSFLNPLNIAKDVSVIILKDKNDHPRNQKRIDAMYSILKSNVKIEIIESKEDKYVFRMFDLLYFLDWVSFYLAILYKTDPTPIPVITKLKNLLHT